MQTNENMTILERANTAFISEKSETNTAVTFLNDLISLNRDIIKVYETAVDRLEKENNIRLLNNYAQQHERFVTELSNLVVRFGGKPASSGSGSGLAKQAWVTLKAAVTDGDGSVLVEIVPDSEKVLMAYSATMAQDIPEEARELLRRHLTDARLAHKKLSAMSVAYSN